MNTSLRPRFRAAFVASLMFFAVSCGTDDKSKDKNNVNNENNVNNVNNVNNESDMGESDMDPSDMEGDQGTSCEDGIQNGDESDIDCGGSCDACEVGESCVEDNDCLTERCLAETCAEPLVVLGGECISNDQCESGECTLMGTLEFCTTTCTDTCDGADLACFQDTCVPGTLCIDPDQDGYGEGPGCTGTPCDRCDTNATCSEDQNGTFDCACNTGYDGDGFTCANIDECAEGTAGCATDATCTDNDGGFECDCNAGYSGDGTACANIDECTLGTDTCANDAACTDTDGSFGCACDPGFAGDGFTCMDNDECALGTATCDTNAACINEDGGYDCVCDSGFSGNGMTCTNIDECATNQDNCGANTDCQDSVGSFSCTCQAGFTGDPVVGCTDVNECATNQDNCGANSECANTAGAFTCTCTTGYEGDPVAGCTNIDECAISSSCGANTICVDTDPGFVCACGLGYEGDPYTGCTDKNECDLGTDACVANSDCTNTPGNYVCSCASGFTGNGYVQCENVDECALNQDDCDPNAACTDNSGSFTCACNTGYSGTGQACTRDGDVCADAFSVGALPFTGTGDTTTAASDYGYEDNVCPGEPNRWGNGSNDEVWSFTPTATGNYEIGLDAAYDSNLYVVTDCADIDNSCLGANETNGAESLALLLTQGITYFVIVDGYGNTSNQDGAYTLTVDVDECADGTDTCPAVSTCSNTTSGFDCVCDPGYELVGAACVNIDECSEGTDDCDPTATCTDTPGSFTCTCAPPLIGDGQDCYDPTALGETCANPYIVGALPFSVTNYDTTDNGSDYGYSDGVCPPETGGWGSGSNDEVFQFTAPADAQYTFEINAQFDATLYVVTDCADIDNTCLGGDDTSLSSGTETVILTLTAGQVVNVIVDGYGNTFNQDGTYDFTVTSP